MKGNTISADRYDVFHRTWWQPGPHGGRVPGAGERHYMAHGVTWSEARAMCKEWNDTHDLGPLSDKAEFETA